MRAKTRTMSKVVVNDKDFGRVSQLLAGRIAIAVEASRREDDAADK